MAVVVEVDEAGSPADEATVDGESCLVGDVVEVALAVIAIESRGLVVEMRAHDVEVAVEVVVADADAHAAHALAFEGGCDASQQGFFAKSAIAIIHKQVAERGVAGEEDVGPAVFVDVKGDSGKSIGAGERGDAGFIGDVGKGAVAVVAE